MPFFFDKEVCFMERSKDRDSSRSPSPNFDCLIVTAQVAIARANARMVADFFQQDAEITHLLWSRTDLRDVPVACRAIYRDLSCGLVRTFQVTAGVVDWMQQGEIWAAPVVELSGEAARNA